jgi:hypothetical protein
VLSSPGFNSTTVFIITVLSFIAFVLVVGAVILASRYRRMLIAPSVRCTKFLTQARTSHATAPLYFKASLDQKSEKLEIPVFFPYIAPADHAPFSDKALPTVEARITACHWPAAPARGHRIFGIAIPSATKDLSGDVAAPSPAAIDARLSSDDDARPLVPLPALATWLDAHPTRHPIEESLELSRSPRMARVGDLA